MYKYKIILLFITIFIISCDNNENIPDDEEPIPLSETELLLKVQKDAFKYFWDYAESNSKLARERYHTDETWVDEHLVTTGGSGFGLMNIIVGIENGFVNRTEAVQRLQTALNFLDSADRFHGAWPHWMNGLTGDVVPFGSVDNGGDIVETAFLCQSLISVREYFKNGTTEEKAIAQKADDLWKGVEWSWYTKGENALYWHWSPNYEWQLNHKLQGYDETLITYILGVSSPTFPISVNCYHEGWAKGGQIVSSGKYFDYEFVLKHNGTNTVGPLFWAHYSFLGLNPKGLTDNYANYELLTKNHAKIYHKYCTLNPYSWNGYSDECWGLTASYSRNYDGTVGYSAHQMNNDKSIISPTAAISSYPYSPEESLKFLRYLYEKTENKYVGIIGPYDAFSPHHNWVTKRYLAIDQGTIVPMIENYKTGLLWNLFMNAPEVRQGLINMGFHSTQHNF